AERALRPKRTLGSPLRDVGNKCGTSPRFCQENVVHFAIVVKGRLCPAARDLSEGKRGARAARTSVAPCAQASHSIPRWVCASPQAQEAPPIRRRSAPGWPTR